MNMTLSPQSVPIVLVCLMLGMLCAPCKLEAQMPAKDVLSLLESHLPAKMPAERANCQQLAVALHAAVFDRPGSAYALVSMALTVPGGEKPRWLHRVARKFECGCVARITQAALTAAPSEGSKVLEASVMLFPDCAESLTAMLTETEAQYAQLSLANGANTGGEGNIDSDGFGSGAGSQSPSAPGGGDGTSSSGTLPPPVLPPITADTNG